MRGFLLGVGGLGGTPLVLVAPFACCNDDSCDCEVAGGVDDDGGVPTGVGGFA